MDKTKLYKYYNIGIRSAIIFAALLLLYRELSSKNILEYRNLLENYFQNSAFLYSFVLIIVLMPLNWSIEALKWRYIVSSKEVISFPLSLKGIFAGATVSSLSPNRIGDFLGRVFVLKKVSFLQGTFITLIGSYAQTLISLIVGFIALGIFVFNANYFNEARANYIEITFILSALVIILITFLYYKISILSKIVPKKWSKIYGYIQVLANYRFSELSNILLYSLLRYFIFSSQFVIMLWAVGFHFPIHHLYIIVSIIFFINMFRPSIAIVEFAIRGAVSVSVFTAYFEYYNIPIMEDTPVIIASTLIWFINIILPALIGLFFIKNMRFFKLSKR